MWETVPSNKSEYKTVRLITDLLIVLCCIYHVVGICESQTCNYLEGLKDRILCILPCILLISQTCNYLCLCLRTRDVDTRPTLQDFVTRISLIGFAGTFNAIVQLSTFR